MKGEIEKWSFLEKVEKNFNLVKNTLPNIKLQFSFY